MKYFLISDVHSEYTKLKAALQEAGFNAETDTLVSLGDLFDRGNETVEVLEYVMHLPHTIFILGNHDARLYDMFYGSPQHIYDKTNGTIKTIKALTGRSFFLDEDSSCLNPSRNISLLRQYFNELVGAVEFTNYVASHAWLDPNFWIYKDYMPYFERESWADSHTQWRIGNFPNKKLVIGHFHACRWRIPAGASEYDVNNIYADPDAHKIYEDKHIVAIDGCTNIRAGRVNVFVIEDEPENVKLYGKMR